ncbi:MAG TPA: hypothetical protein DHV44_15100 [Providencia sp.]|nr:hypothetical protein [Providencia sp.]
MNKESVKSVNPLNFRHKNRHHLKSTGFNIKTYLINYKHFIFIQFRIMLPIMSPFYFVTQKLRGSGFSFPKATSIAKYHQLVISLQIMKYQPEIVLLVFSTTSFQTEL